MPTTDGYGKFIFNLSVIVMLMKERNIICYIINSHWTYWSSVQYSMMDHTLGFHWTVKRERQGRNEPEWECWHEWEKERGRKEGQVRWTSCCGWNQFCFEKGRERIYIGPSEEVGVGSEFFQLIESILMGHSLYFPHNQYKNTYFFPINLWFCIHHMFSIWKVHSLCVPHKNEISFYK